MISIAVVAAAAIYAKKAPKDAVPSVKEVEGKIELRLLDSIPSK